MPGKKHQPGRPDRANEITDIDNQPGAQHFAQTDFSGRHGHDHQCVAGKQFGAANDHQNEAEAEHEAGKQSADAKRNDTVRARQNGGREHGAKGDEGAAEHAKNQQAERVEPRFLRADQFGLAGNFRRQQSVDAVA